MGEEAVSDDPFTVTLSQDYPIMNGPIEFRIVYTTGSGFSDTVSFQFGLIEPPSLSSFPYDLSSFIGDYGEIAASPVIEDLDLDGIPEIIVAIYNPSYIDGYVCIINPATEEILPIVASGRGFPNTPAVGDLDRDGYPDIVALSKGGQLFAWNRNGGELPGFPLQLPTGGPQIKGSPILEDFNGDGYLEILAATPCGSFGNPEDLFLINNTGHFIWNASVNGTIYSTPTVGDVDNDGILDILLATDQGTTHQYGFVTRLRGDTGEEIWCHTVPIGPGGRSPALGDIDSDGNMDLVFASGNLDGGSGYVDAWDATDGTQLWYTGVWARPQTSVVIGDIIADDRLEILCGDDGGMINFISSEGMIRSMFSCMPTANSFCIADVDEDTQNEFITATYLYGDGHSYIQIIKGTGECVSIPVSGCILKASPALADVDNDGDLDIVVVTFDGIVSSYELGTQVDNAQIQWATHQHDNYNTNCYHFEPYQLSAPDAPMGPPAGLPDELYAFSSSVFAPHELDIFYKWDWGDGTFSDWLGPFAPGEVCTATHSWSRGIYDVRVKIKIDTIESDWSDPSAIELFVPGDANGDGRAIGNDITYLVQYFRGNNPAPYPFLSGDANGDCQVLGNDVTYLVRYFRGIGPAPVQGDCW